MRKCLLIIKVNRNYNENDLRQVLPGIEEITKGQAHTKTRKLYRDISTGTARFKLIIIIFFFLSSWIRQYVRVLSFFF